MLAQITAGDTKPQWVVSLRQGRTVNVKTQFGTRATSSDGPRPRDLGERTPKFTLKGLGVVFLSWGCPNSLPHTGWLQASLFPHSSGGQNLELKYGEGRAPSEGSRGEYVPASSGSRGSKGSLVYGSVTPPSASDKSPSYKNTPAIGFRPIRNPG